MPGTDLAHGGSDLVRSFLGKVMAAVTGGDR
jgi:hypothetical protein